MVETLGGGCGWLDYDRDGWWDLYLVQGGRLDSPERDASGGDRLFQSRVGSRFRDVTTGACIVECAYSQGVAIGDYDNDGFDDVYVTNLGANTLYRNRGDGTFEDATAQSGTGDPRWSTSAAWADLDRDGDLDLYVCNYLRYDPRDPVNCTDARGNVRMCLPEDFEAWPDALYFNEGDGTFREAAAERGLTGSGNKSLGVAVADFNNDRWPDIYVANDTTPNFLFLNQGDGRFKDVALPAGCAVSHDGTPQASMGVAVGDYDRDGWLDIYVTHFTSEPNTLYQNLGEARFADVTRTVGLERPTLWALGFGAVMEDFNQDGSMDVFISNGHIDDWRDRREDYRMVPQMFSYERGRWREQSDAGGGFFRTAHLGRGVAGCDYDNDGDTDLAIVHQDTPVAVLRNDSRRGHWLGVQLIGTDSNRRGIGARVTVRQGETTLARELLGGTSYCASHQPVLHFGLGDSTQSCTLVVHWPGGEEQRISGLEGDQHVTVLQGVGVRVDR